MVKTVILSGAEVCVDGLGALNAAIKNLGSETIWASIFPNVQADADNVVEIPAGSGEVVLDANGTVYLLGTGKVQCTGTPYATVNFKMPSSSSGGGGDTPAPSAETMPVMDGVTDCFGTSLDLLYLTKFSLSSCSIDDEAILMASRSGHAEIYSTDMPVIVYIIFKTPNNGTIIDRSVINGDRDFGYGLGVNVSDGKILSHSCSYNSINSNVTADEYHVVAVVEYDIGNGKTEQRLYIDGELIGTNSNDYSTSAQAYEKYYGYMALNGVARPAFRFDGDTNLYVKYFAMGSVAHTEEQIKQNSAWLMRKYITGGDLPVFDTKTMPVMDGIGGYYVPETIDLGSGNWNSAVSGKPIKFAENKQLLSSKTVLTSSYGLLEFPDPFRVLYMAAKIRDPNDIASNASVYLVTEISDTASGNNFAVKLNPFGSHDLVVFSEGGSPSYNTDHSGNDMTVLCVTRDNDNNVSVYVNGEKQGDIGVIGSSGYVGKLCVNGYCDTEMNFSEKNTYLTEWSCFAVGTEMHTAEQIAQNSAWLMSKYGIGE